MLHSSTQFIRSSISIFSVAVSMVLVSGCFSTPFTSNNTQFESASSGSQIMGNSALFSPAQQILETNCVSCHSYDHSSFGTMNESQFISSGMIIPGAPNQSLLFEMITGSGVGAGGMPLGGQLATGDIATLQQWITNANVPTTTTLTASQRTAAALQVLQNSCNSCHNNPNYLQQAPFVGQQGALFNSAQSVIGAFSQNPPTASPPISPASSQVAEVIFYSQALSNTDRATVECYLAQKYALTVSETCTSNNATPASVSGLSLWLKADTIGLSNGASVSMWNDSSGTGVNHTGTGTNGAMPTLVSNAINGLPAVQLVNSWLYGNMSVSGLPQATAIIVYKSLTPSTGAEQDLWTFGFQTQKVFGMGISGSPTANQFLIYALGQTTADAGVLYSTLATAPADGNWHIETETYISTGTLSGFIDGPVAPSTTLSGGRYSGQAVPAFGTFTNDTQFALAGLVVAEDPTSSWLYQSLNGFGSLGDMPQGTPALTAAQAKTLSTWISQMGDP